jgi:hypothetical protein
LDKGARISRIDILRAIRKSQRCSTVPYVRPGGEILLRLSGWPKVEKALQSIDIVEALGIDPAESHPSIGATPDPRQEVDFNEVRECQFSLRCAASP